MVCFEAVQANTQEVCMVSFLQLASYSGMENLLLQDEKFGKLEIIAIIV